MKSVEPPKPGIIIEPGAENVRTKTANGLQTVTFDMLQGTVTVNLPDDIRAGDTFSGTVFTEPKGNTPEEKAVNQKVLNGTVLDLAGTRIQAGGDPRFTWTPLMPQPNMPIQYRLKIVEVLGNPTPMTQSGAVITPDPTTARSGVIVTPDPKITQKFNIPDLGQTGRNIMITGSFDGNSLNTNATIQPSAAPAENLQILAESHGMAILRSPTNLTGPMRLSVSDGTTLTTSMFRNVDVNLSAPKTNLLKGDSTTLTVRFRGLQGIKRDVSFRLEKSGVVTMQGGDVQTRSIKPSEVQADGSFTMTRTMTGTQAGAFSVTATVIVE